MADTVMAADPSILDRLKDALGDDRVDTSDDLRARHTHDWTGIHGAVPAAVIRPRSVEEVSTFLRLCHEHRQPVAVQGGLTGLAGAASCQAGEIALSLERLNRVERVEDGAIIVEAGATIAAAQAAALEAGAELGIDFGARGTATVGGAISTNAGGLHVIETGMTRPQVLGLEVVLADGRVLTELTAMVKVNSGFDLKHLFIGSEGALGVITRACFALRPHRAGVATALVALDSPDRLKPALAEARRHFGPDLSAFEAMWPDYVETMSARSPFSLPLAAPMLVILEVRDAEADRANARMQSFLEAGAESGLVVDAVVAQSGAQAKSLWQLRDEGPACYDQAFASFAAFDVSIPLAILPRVAEEVAAPFRAEPGLHPLTYGHIGDQNLHFVIGSDEKLDEAAKKAIYDRVYGTIARNGGAISAEHGIGVLKKPYLSLARSPVAIEVMRSLKRTLDPHHILNPGRVIDV